LSDNAVGGDGESVVAASMPVISDSTHGECCYGVNECESSTLL